MATSIDPSVLRKRLRKVAKRLHAQMGLDQDMLGRVARSVSDVEEELSRWHGDRRVADHHQRQAERAENVKKTDWRQMNREDLYLHATRECGLVFKQGARTPKQAVYAKVEQWHREGPGR